jgi:hypothetical protein
MTETGPTLANYQDDPDHAAMIEEFTTIRSITELIGICMVVFFRCAQLLEERKLVNDGAL